MSNELTIDGRSVPGDATAQFLSVIIASGIDFQTQEAVIKQTVSKWGGWFGRKKLWERRFEITVRELPCEYQDNK